MLNDPSISTAIGLALEKCLNLALRYDPATQAKLRTLNNKIIKLSCRSPNIDLVFFIENEKVRVSTADQENDADVVISGEASEFLSLLGQSTHSLNDLNIEISGKVNILNQIKTILADLDIDWEEPLTEILGIVPGHALAESLRASFHWIKKQSTSLAEAIPDLLSEELRAVPSATELKCFYQDVDQLSSDSQRIDARIQRIKHSLANQQN